MSLYIALIHPVGYVRYQITFFILFLLSVETPLWSRSGAAPQYSPIPPHQCPGRDASSIPVPTPAPSRGRITPFNLDLGVPLSTVPSRRISVRVGMPPSIPMPTSTPSRGRITPFTLDLGVPLDTVPSRRISVRVGMPPSIPVPTPAPSREDQIRRWTGVIPSEMDGYNKRAEMREPVRAR